MHLEETAPGKIPHVLSPAPYPPVQKINGIGQSGSVLLEKAIGKIVLLKRKRKWTCPQNLNGC